VSGQLTFGSLFAGIGGFDLGFERAGMKCVWQVEINEYASRVLRKHWPHVRQVRDVRSFLTGDAMCCAADFPAKTSAMPEQSKDLPASAAVFGGKCSEWFAYFDRDSSSWKTSQRSLIEGMSEFSATWPASGLMVNGKCYRRAPSVRHIHERGCFTFSTLTVVSCEHPGRRKIKPTQQSCVSAELARRDDWQAGGQLNPNHAAWFMGFPESWTNLDHMETPSSLKSPNGSVEES
jgi:hypothetical protein